MIMGKYQAQAVFKTERTPFRAITRRNSNLPAEKVSNRMPSKVPYTIIMGIGNFNLRCIMPVEQIKSMITVNITS